MMQDSKGELGVCSICGGRYCEKCGGRGGKLKNDIWEFCKICDGKGRITPKEDKREEWISVKEALPSTDKPVVVRGDGLYRVYFWALGGWVQLENAYFKSMEITHWMPLPSPPKDQTEKECKNRECDEGVIHRNYGDPRHPTVIDEPCPDCKKDQTIQEEREK